MGWRNVNLIGSVKIPTLILHGTADKTCPFHMGQTLSDRLPSATFITIKDGKHEKLYDMPGFMDHVEAYLSKLDSKPGQIRAAADGPKQK